MPFIILLSHLYKLHFSPSPKSKPKPTIKPSPFPFQFSPIFAMALLLQAPLFALFFLTAFSPSLAFPWNSSPFDKSGWNPSFEELLLASGETSGRPSRRKNTIFGAPCGLCGQVIFGSEALNHHYNYHFLQSELASFGSRSNPCSGSSQRPPSWANYFHGQSSASREPQMTLNDYLTMPPPRQPPSLRSYSGAAVDMAHLLPLHPLLAQPPPPPRTTVANGINVQQNQAAAGQLGQRRQGNQIRWNNGGGRAAVGRPAAEPQPPQDVIDLNEEHDCSSDGSEGLDLTLSL